MADFSLPEVEDNHDQLAIGVDALGAVWVIGPHDPRTEVTTHYAADGTVSITARPLADP